MYVCSPHEYTIELKKFTTNCFNKILCKTIIIDFKICQKWNFAFSKLKFGMLEWDCVRIGW